MSYVKGDVIYEQLRQLLEEGKDLSDYRVVECDNFGGEALIIPMEDSDDD